MDEVSLESYLSSVARSLSQCFANWSRMPPEVWAEEIYRLPNGGRFRWSYAPYARRMFQSIFDHRNIETNFQLYSRGLKSTVVLLAIGYTIDQDPRRILSLWPTNSQAEKFSKDILTGELFDTTEPLRFLGSAASKRIGSNTLLHKLFPGGLIDLFGANAPGDMRRAKGSLLYADEIDAIDTTLTDEGDQLAIFNKRGDEYPDTIRIFCSYPSLKGASRIASRMSETDGNQWFSTCVKCGGEPFVMTRALLRHDEGRAETARFECPRCGEMLNDADRYTMAHLQGFDNWKPAREFRGKSGFHGNAMLWPHPVDLGKYPGGFLQLLAQQEIDAKNAENPKRALRVLVNTVDAEPFDPTDETEKAPEWSVIYGRREDYEIVPAAALVLTAMVDVQVNRLEVEWKATGKNGENWGLDHVVLDGNTKHPDVWQKALCRELQRKFKHELGGEMALDMGFIDGGWAAEYVYAFMQWLAANPVPGVTGKIRASKGIGKHGHPIVDRRWMTIARNLKGYHMGTWEAKDLINQRLRMSPNDDGSFPDGYMHFNKNYDEEYFRQLCTGIPTIVYEVVNGELEEVKKFLNEPHFKDEALDLSVGNLAAFRLRHWNFEAKAEELTVRPDEPKKEELPSSVGGRGWSF